MDFVFIDGPHTYANVRNEPRLVALLAGCMKSFFSLQPFLFLLRIYICGSHVFAVVVL